MSETKFTVGNDKKTLIIERTFNAPRERVWEAWTTPDIFVKWWGPRGWQTIIKHMDFREGGYLHYGMKCEDPKQTDWYGRTSWGKSTYGRISPQDTFDYIDVFCDENGRLTPGMPAMKITLQFIEDGGKTKLVSTTTFDKPEDLEQVLQTGMREGLTQTWDRLGELVSR
jgi:uncharacterized protein YndB with AHSA1/START domain